MCSTAADWFNRYVTCCVASPRRRSRGDVSNSLTQFQRRCSSAPRSRRRRHDLDLGGLAARLFRRWRCRRHNDEERVKCTDAEDGNDVMTDRLPVFTVGDDVDSKLLTGLEYVCCCERCDSVVGWYLTSVTTDLESSEQSLKVCSAGSSMRLQNYMVACESSRIRPDKKSSPVNSSHAKDIGMSCVSLIPCDIKGVDLLVGHQMKKTAIEDVKLVNELVSCFRPPPNRTIGHIYLAVAAADTSSSRTISGQRRS